MSQSLSIWMDCEQHGEGSELFLVEGESASLAVGRVRDVSYQAVCPLQGKPRNALKSSKVAIERNPVFARLLDVLRVRLDGAQSPTDLPFERILLLLDPDADGVHCGMLLTWFFYRWLPTILDAGIVSLVQPPVMLLRRNDDIVIPVYSEQEAVQLSHEWKQGGIELIQRTPVRGLASIPSDLLHTTCISPSTRRTYRLSSADALRSLEVVDSLKRSRRAADPP